MHSIDDLITKVQRAIDQRNLETRVFLEEQSIRKGLGPALWDELARTVINGCDRLAGLTSERDGKELVIRCVDTAKTTRLRYCDQVPCVFYKSPEREGYMPFLVFRETVALSLLVDGETQAPDEITARLLGSLCESR